MSVIDIIDKISNTKLVSLDLKYCLVDKNKHPFKIDGTPARSNCVDDFVSLTQLLLSDQIDTFAGVGISIQASNICAIDVDHCFSVSNDVNSGDERAKYCLNLFKDVAYCEFSFSGTGLRIIFKASFIGNYSDSYYIKNDKCNVEYYQPSKSFRYVTLTGNVIYNNLSDNIQLIDSKVLEFLNKYMKRQRSFYSVYTENITENRSFDELMSLVKKQYRIDSNFQNLWFTCAPGSGKDESERDYHLVAYLYDYVTRDKDMIQKIFEQSEFFKTKDSHHIYKWTNNNYRYFNYLYNTISKNKC